MTVFLGLSFYICLNAYKLDDSLIFIQKKNLGHIFLFWCHVLSFGSSGLNCEFIHMDYGFSWNSKISLIRSGDKPILIFKISVKNFPDFVIKIVLLEQNNFEWIAFCWVESIVYFWTSIENLKSFVIVTSFWLFQFY